MADLEGKLKDSGRDALVEIAERLAGGFTGRMLLICNEGGVRRFRVKEDVPLGEKRKKRKHLTT